WNPRTGQTTKLVMTTMATRAGQAAATTTAITEATVEAATGRRRRAVSERVLRARGRVEAAEASARVGSLFDAHGRMVLGVCRLLWRAPAEAEDAAQQTFLSAHRALLGGGRPRDEAAWLGAIARNECRARIRARLRAPLPLAETTLSGLRAPVDD